VTATTEQAYQVCEAITRDQARNFHYGIRLLPTEKRSALCALYALSRRIDDVGDGDLPLPEKTAALARIRKSLADIGASDDPVLVAVADAARRYPVPLPAFDELVDGVQMDIEGRRYDTFEDLVGYCRCVAGSVGRLCLGVFSDREDANASGLADALGIALQQTNILRDIREDLGNARVYLPRRDLESFEVELRLDEHGRLADPAGQLATLIVAAAGRARGWYAIGLRLLPLLDRRSAACTAAMAGIYRRLLDRIAADPTRVYGQRLSLSTWQKATVAARALMGVTA
jgi:phytoene synthase